VRQHPRVDGRGCCLTDGSLVVCRCQQHTHSHCGHSQELSWQCRGVASQQVGLVGRCVDYENNESRSASLAVESPAVDGPSGPRYVNKSIGSRLSSVNI